MVVFYISVTLANYPAWNFNIVLMYLYNVKCNGLMHTKAALSL